MTSRRVGADQFLYLSEVLMIDQPSSGGGESSAQSPLAIQQSEASVIRNCGQHGSENGRR